MALTPLEQKIAKQVDKISIPELASRFGIKIISDANMICPFPEHLHTNNTPSFRYYPRTNTMNCFGSCHCAGGTFNFLRAMLHNNSKDALDYAKNELHIKVQSLAKSFAALAKSLEDDAPIIEELPLELSIYEEQDKLQDLGAYRGTSQFFLLSLLLASSGYDVQGQNELLYNKLLEKNKSL